MATGRRLALGLVSVAIAGGGLFGASRAFGGKNEGPQGQPVAVTRGDLRLAVTATGALSSPRTADLSFRSSGVVEQVNVQVGDEVKKGQPLARLELRPLELAVAQAEISLRTAQLNLETLRSSARPEEMASAQAALESARQRLATMEAQGLPEDVAAAEAAVQSASVKLDQLLNPKATDLLSAQSAVAAAKGNLASADQRVSQLRNPTAADIAAAESAVASARAKVDTLRNPSAGDVASARAAVDTARSSYQTALTKLNDLRNPPADQVATANAAVRSAEAGVESAQAKIDSLLLPLDTEKRRGLVDAYLQLYIARQRLIEAQARTVSNEEMQAVEAEVLRALRLVDALEADAKLPNAGVTAQDLRVARSSLDSARDTLDSATVKLEKLRNPSPQDVAVAESSAAAAKASLASAEARLQQLLNPSPDDVAAAEASLQSSIAKLGQLRNPTAADITSAEASAATARIGLQIAEAKLRDLQHPVAVDIAAASAALDQARAGLEKARAPYKEADLTGQRASVAGAESQVAKLLLPGTALDIAKAQLAVDRAKLDLDQARFNLENGTLLAPIDGVVSQVSIKPGASQGVGASTVVMSIVDPSVMQVSVNVDETDIAKVALNQDVVVTVEAAGAIPYRGRVAAIAPAAATQSGVTSYAVTISVATATGERGPAGGQDRAQRPAGGQGQGQDRGQRPAGGQGQGRQDPQDQIAARRAAGPQQLRVGMTAVASITYESKESVLLLPNRAIKTVNRERTVQLLVSGKPETRVIRTGVSDDQRTEILEGLSEGEEVLMEQPSATGTARTQAPGGFGPGGFGGGGVFIGR